MNPKYYEGLQCQKNQEHSNLRYKTTGACISCAKDKLKIRRATPEGKAGALKSTLQWREKNYEKTLAYSRQYHRDNRARYNAHWYKYHADQMQRTPAWADVTKIVAIYEMAKQQGLSVDHIIPLRGKRVSGLHVEYNLQLIPLLENVRKSNCFEV